MAIFLSVLLVSLTCTNDVGCGAGKVCVQPEGEKHAEGVCAVPPPAKKVKWGASFVRDATACEHKFDCDLDGKCVKAKHFHKGVCSY